ncbi:UrcA family protein [Erythrobacter sp.]|uniref:UrcA family protein n=1 Tax=Erythrobacter sp. TaxID=1042 RepID=UPI001425C18E|nr:UrcA family protein [Erythrobacter sp.]QIQ85255.1 MAG: UrcA family protein [Erythrobacter sp.]QIQ88006.1 MAG: UrcA family protein [Erythrobacter sp.]
MFKTLYAAAALATLAVAAPASAKEEAVSVTVSFAGLDIASKDGFAAFEQRIDTAIDRACRINGRRTLAEMRAVRDCKASMTTSAELAVAELLASPERFASANEITLRG